MRASLAALLTAHRPVVTLVLARFPNALGTHAFGSQVQGTAGVQSDLDLALLAAGYADPLALWDSVSAVADVVGMPVDLLDLRAASTVMQSQILIAGKRLWATNVQAGLFECVVLSEKPPWTCSVLALLAAGGWIDAQLAEALKHMVAFRNIAVHDDQILLLPILVKVITGHL